MTINKDSAWPIINQLGQSQALQIIDINRNEQPFSLPYSKQLKQCEDALRNLSFLEAECKRFRVPLRQPKDTALFESALEELTYEKGMSQAFLFEELDKDITQKVKFIREQIGLLKEMKV